MKDVEREIDPGNTRVIGPDLKHYRAWGGRSPFPPDRSEILRSGKRFFALQGRIRQTAGKAHVIAREQNGIGKVIVGRRRLSYYRSGWNDSQQQTGEE